MKNWSTIACTALLLGVLSGCVHSGPAQTDTTQVPSKAIATQATQTEPVTVTMFSYWNDKETDGGLAVFRQAISERFPEINLEVEIFPTGVAPYSDELGRRVSHHVEADLMMTSDTSLWDSGALMDLTQQEMTGRYSVAVMKQLSKDGTIYFLPSVGNVLCYILNDTQLTQLGMEPPTTLDELETMMGGISDAGGHPFLVPYEQTEPRLIQVLAAGYLATPEGQIWLERYHQGETTMKGNPHWEEIWQRAGRMVDAGFANPVDALLAEGRRIKEMAQGNGTMTTISSTNVNTLNSKNEQGFEFLLLPLLGENPENQTVFSAPTGYFAASSRLNQPGNEAKRAAVLDILDFISTEAGQNAIRGNVPLANSYLRDVELSLTTQAQNISKLLHEGAFGPMPELQRGVEEVLGTACGKLIRGEMTAEQAMDACDAQNAAYQVGATPPPPVVLGTASEEFPWTYNSSRTRELAVTNFVVDSIRAAAGTEIALELGTAVRGELFKGEVTNQDILSVLRMDKKLYRAQVTGQQLWDIIEQGVKDRSSSWFVTVSGLQYRYRPAAGETPGQLLSLTTADGTPIDLEKTYDVGLSENQMMQVNNVYTFFGTEGEMLEPTLREAVSDRIGKLGTISPLLEGRIQTEGTN